MKQKIIVSSSSSSSSRGSRSDKVAARRMSNGAHHHHDNSIDDHCLVVQHNYHDHANDPIVTESFPDPMPNRGGVAVPFPLKLFEMFEQIDSNDDEESKMEREIVSWQPHGRCFVIHDLELFKDTILPKYFSKLHKITSFQRQLNLYGFLRLTQGPDKSGYYHEYFLRGRKDLTRNFARLKVKGTKVRAKSNPDSEPDFYNAIPWVTLSTAHQTPTSSSAVAHQRAASTGTPKAAVSLSTKRLGTGTTTVAPSSKSFPTNLQVSPPSSPKKRKSPCITTKKKSSMKKEALFERFIIDTDTLLASSQYLMNITGVCTSRTFSDSYSRAQSTISVSNDDNPSAIIPDDVFTNISSMYHQPVHAHHQKQIATATSNSFVHLMNMKNDVRLQPVDNLIRQNHNGQQLARAAIARSEYMNNNSLVISNVLGCTTTPSPLREPALHTSCSTWNSPDRNRSVMQMNGIVMTPNDHNHRMMLTSPPEPLRYRGKLNHQHSYAAAEDNYPFAMLPRTNNSDNHTELVSCGEMLEDNTIWELNEVEIGNLIEEVAYDDFDFDNAVKVVVGV